MDVEESSEDSDSESDEKGIKDGVWFSTRGSCGPALLRAQLCFGDILAFI